MNPKLNVSGPWWGECHLDFGQTARVRVGTMTFLLQRLSRECRIARLSGQGDKITTASFEVGIDVEEVDAFEEVDRFSLRDNDLDFTISPVLADRPIVSRPEQPFHVPAGGQATLYVGSPLWCRIALGKRSLTLLEFPVHRPSDTWFGPTTMEGELCYASRTFCRLHLSDVTLRPHRAVTCVKLDNRASTPLSLERIKLPAPQLTLFKAPDGQLWTQDITFSRTDVQEQEFAVLKPRRNKPEQVPDAVAIANPREQIDENPVVRTFSALFR